MDIQYTSTHSHHVLIYQASTLIYLEKYAYGAGLSSLECDLVTYPAKTGEMYHSTRFAPLILTRGRQTKRAIHQKKSAKKKCILCFVFFFLIMLGALFYMNNGKFVSFLLIFLCLFSHRTDKQNAQCVRRNPRKEHVFYVLWVLLT